MSRWVAYAFVSMFFAGVTSVIAKRGLAGITGELGLAVRTLFVFVFVLGFAALMVPRDDIARLTNHHVGWLALSALTTSLSWGFYYKALELGEVSTVALIDKGSFVVAVLLAWIWLGESMTPQKIAGMCLVVAGLAVVSWKPN